MTLRPVSTAMAAGEVTAARLSRLRRPSRGSADTSEWRGTREDAGKKELCFLLKPNGKNWKRLRSGRRARRSPGPADPSGPAGPVQRSQNPKILGQNSGIGTSLAPGQIPAPVPNLLLISDAFPGLSQDPVLVQPGPEAKPRRERKGRGRGGDGTNQNQMLGLV